MPPIVQAGSAEPLGMLHACRDRLFAQQHANGHWCAELEGDTILESEYILTLHFLGRTHETRVRKAAEYIRRQQRPEGGWACYPGGPPDPSVSVKNYLVLKLVGDDPAAPHMARARRTILELGGIGACNSFTRIYLAIFGQYPWKLCPAIPPEIILLPASWCFSIYSMSAWSRTIVVPLSILRAAEPRCELPAYAHLDELWTDAVPQARRHTSWKARAWSLFFRGLDRGLKLCGRSPWKPWRARALAQAEQWILKRLQKSAGLGAIFPPLINTIYALRCLGYGLDHPVLRAQVQELEDLEIEDDETLRVQPCKSPVWDTAISLEALLEAGTSSADPRLLQAARWLLAHEVTEPGDWQRKLPGVPPGGWYFEYANEPYPDVDDTAQVLQVLARVGFPDPEEEKARVAAIGRGLRWVLAMQNDDGGWGAFDRGCDREILTFVPFADHNAMIDPSCEDVTARTVQALHTLGLPRQHPAVDRALAFLWKCQDADGTWYGRWGCNHVYGTWLALGALRVYGVPAEDPRLQRAARWLEEHQNPDGGWGETPLSYDDPGARGKGPSTASQTAWALLALDALERWSCTAFARGLQYLRATQRGDGSWYDEPWTGTGFPRVFYLRYHLYATYFPLMALARAVERPVADGGQAFPEGAQR